MMTKIISMVKKIKLTTSNTLEELSKSQSRDTFMNCNTEFAPRSKPLITLKTKKVKLDFGRKYLKECKSFVKPLESKLKVWISVTYWWFHSQSSVYSGNNKNSTYHRENRFMFCFVWKLLFYLMEITCVCPVFLWLNDYISLLISVIGHLIDNSHASMAAWWRGD